MDKYKFYNSDNKVIAVSTYAGKTVRGVAKCDPEDTFYLKDGQELAAARCREKIAEKRLNRATRKYAEAYNEYKAAQNYLNKMFKYLSDAEKQLDEAHKNVEDVLNKIAP